MFLLNLEPIHYFWAAALLIVVGCFVLVCCKYCITKCCRRKRRNSTEPKKPKTHIVKKPSEDSSIQSDDELKDEENHEYNVYQPNESYSSNESTVKKPEPLETKSACSEPDVPDTHPSQKLPHRLNVKNIQPKTVIQQSETTEKQERVSSHQVKMASSQVDISKPTIVGSSKNRSEKINSQKSARLDNSVAITIDNPELPKAVIVTQNEKPEVTVVDIDPPQSKSEKLNSTESSKFPVSEELKETMKDTLYEPMTKEFYRRASRRLKKKLNESMNESMRLNMELQQLNATMLNQSMLNFYNSKLSLAGSAHPDVSNQFQSSLPPLYPHQSNLMYQHSSLPSTGFNGAAPLLNPGYNLPKGAIPTIHHGNLNSTLPNFNNSTFNYSNINGQNFNSTMPTKLPTPPYVNSSINSAIPTQGSTSTGFTHRNLEDCNRKIIRKLSPPQNLINSTEILNPMKVATTKREPYEVVLKRSKNQQSN